MQQETAGELSIKAMSDTTKYDALEVGHALSEDIHKHLMDSVALHIDIINEPEFCVVMVISSDPLIPNLQRRKFYCWPYLPKPRPNQSVFLYKRSVDRIVKRLWCLPSAMVMAELTSPGMVVHRRYETMQAWSEAFFRGTFWDYIRHEHDIDMLSESEYLLQHREELIKAGCQVPRSQIIEPFDFSKIHINHITDTQTSMRN